MTSASFSALNTPALAIVVAIIAPLSSALAVDLKNLPYPKGEVSGDDVANQVYFVNHFYAYDNFSINKNKLDVTVLLSRSKNRRPRLSTVERHLNNEYDDGNIQSRDLAIFRSGKLRGTGILITDYVDDAKSQSYSIWLPSLRKVRRFAQPAHDDAWGGTDFTFGDVVLRKPKDEDHRILETKAFDECLNAMDLGDFSSRYLKNKPEASCYPKGRNVYVLRSDTKFNDWWYDYRLSYVDTETFADYRTTYFKKGKEVKIIDRDWQPSSLEDPRAQTWSYWYGKTYKTEHETWAIIPPEVVTFNQEVDARFWSERSLRRLKR